MQACDQTEQSGAAVAGLQAEPPAHKGGQHLSGETPVGLQGSCLDELLQNPEVLGASKDQLVQLRDFFFVLSERIGKAAEEGMVPGSHLWT